MGKHHQVLATVIGPLWFRMLFGVPHLYLPEPSNTIRIFASPTVEMGKLTDV